MRLRGIAIRSAVLAAGLLLLLFPDIPRAARQIGHLWNPAALIRPGHPIVARFTDELSVPRELSRRDEARWIARAISDRIRYSYDWIQGWNVDYWPTADEVVATGQDDCDGIAVLTASVLERRGFRARLEGNLIHVWVVVDLAEGPLRVLGGSPTVAFTQDKGWSVPSISHVASGIAFASTRFPIWRWTLLIAWAVAVIGWPARQRSTLKTSSAISSSSFQPS